MIMRRPDEVDVVDANDETELEYDCSVEVYERTDDVRLRASPCCCCNGPSEVGEDGLAGVA